MRHIALTASLLVCPPGLFAGQTDPHIITPGQGLAMIQAYETQKADIGTWIKPATALSYDAESVRKLLSQRGAASFGIYKGIHDGKETFVLFALDAEGKKIDGVNAFALEAGRAICPPDCP